MILQWHPKIVRPWRDSGCYLHSICFLTNKYRGYLLSPEIINALYDKWLKAGYISSQCLVLKPTDIFASMGLRVRWDGIWHPPERHCKPTEMEILRFLYSGEYNGRWVEWIHFVVGDGASHIAFDPWGVSLTASQGQLTDKRIFERLAA